MSMMELILIGIGVLLIWSGVKGKNPVDEIKNVLRG